MSFRNYNICTLMLKALLKEKNGINIIQIISKPAILNCCIKSDLNKPSGKNKIKNILRAYKNINNNECKLIAENIYEQMKDTNEVDKYSARVFMNYYEKIFENKNLTPNN